MEGIDMHPFARAAFFTIIVAISTASARGYGTYQKTSRESADTSIFEKANSTYVDYDRSIFDFETAGCKFNVKSNGSGTKICGGGRPQRFRLGVDRDTRISQLLFFVKAETIYLIEESEDFESGWAEIRAYQLQTMRRRWSQHIRDFNIAPALVEGNHVYLSGVGFVGKLDLINGRYLWTKDGLYEKKMTHEEAMTPTIDGNKVTFPSKGYGLMHFLTFDKRSGKLLSRL